MKNVILNLTLIAILLLVVAVASDKSKTSNKTTDKSAEISATSSFTGWVSDEQCGAAVDAKCNKVCYEKGFKLVFVDTNKKVIPVTNRQILKDYLGQKVTIQAHLQNGALTIASVKQSK